MVGDAPCAAERCCAAQSAAQVLTWPRRMRILLEAAQGMLYLHSMSPALLLRDLKSANLLVTRDWTVKVSWRPNLQCRADPLLLQHDVHSSSLYMLLVCCCQLMLWSVCTCSCRSSAEACLAAILIRNQLCKQPVIR